MARTLIIAEAGVNHNGSKDFAFQLVKKASDAGADIVKFQTFKAEELASSLAEQAEYQQVNTKVIESQQEMLKRLELTQELHHEISDYCSKLGIEFLSTPFDFSSLKFLSEAFDMPILKLPSGELTNAPLVLAFARTGKDMIVSTGMASMDEISHCLKVISFGYLAPEGAVPDANSLEYYYQDERAQSLLKERVTLLHCTTEYPAPKAEVNLSAMDTMRKEFGLSVGYSDHTEGIEIAIAAAAMGASVIEKHFTLDKTMEGPDHKASLEPAELKQLVSSIRNVEKAIGDGKKQAAPSEIKNSAIARKSLIAARDIAKGSILTSEDIIIQRPGTGISPTKYWDVLGTEAISDYSKGDLIK